MIKEATEKRLTRKQKIEQGIPKLPKRKKVYATRLKQERDETVKAILRKYPTSPRKMRLVVDLVRGKKVSDAMNLLKFTPNAGAEPVRKLIKSALSNWDNKMDDQRYDVESLFIKEAFVDCGRMLKRIQPAPQGRAHRVRKRSNHITIILGEIQD